jgi:hypothetical protein
MLYHRPPTNLFSEAADTTVTATAAASGEQEPSATAHDMRVAGANFAYATPEKSRQSRNIIVPPRL